MSEYTMPDSFPRAFVQEDPLPFKVSRDDQFDMPPFTPQQLKAIYKHFGPYNISDRDGSVIIYHAEHEAHCPPVLVGGKLAVFCSFWDRIPFGCAIDITNHAGSAYNNIGSIREELRRGEFPSRASFQALFRLIPDAVALSYFNGAFIVEFARWATRTQHRMRCLLLPSSIAGCPVSAVNGRVRMDMPSNPDVWQDPNYVHSLMDLNRYEILHPGAMVTTRVLEHVGPTAAGILVNYMGNVRLTVSCQGLIDSDADTTVKELRHPSRLGDLIGRITNTIPDSAIALSTLSVGTVFRNNPYFNFPVDLTELLPSIKLRPGQIVGIDTFVKGFEQMVTAGIRAVRCRQPYGSQRASIEEYSSMPDDIATKYQGLFAVNSLTMKERPHFRANRCGAPVVIIRDENDQSNVGGVIGLVRNAEIPGFLQSTVCYADCLDTMIEAGWELELPYVTGSQTS